MEYGEGNRGDEGRHRRVAEAHFGVRNDFVGACEEEPQHCERTDGVEYAVRNGGVVGDECPDVGEYQREHDGQQRHDEYHRGIGARTSCQAAWLLDLPYRVECVFDVAEDTDCRPYEYDESARGDESAARAHEYVVGEVEDVSYQCAVLRESFEKVVLKGCFQSESLDDAECQREHRNERHEREKGERRRADDRIVMLYTLRGVEDEAGLTDEPPLFAGGEVGFRLLPDVVSDEFLGFFEKRFHP